MPNQHILERLDAYLDREFDLASSLDIEGHLDSCTACRAEYENRKALIARVANSGTRFGAPEALRRGVLAGIDALAADQAAALSAEPGKPQPSGHSGARFIAAAPAMRHWLMLAASFVLVAGLSSGATVWMTRGSVPSSLEEQVVASHVRSLLVEDRLTDVASSDEHTVKPWFNHRLDFAPPVDDWTDRGYPLVGGRLDYIANRPVAALVYRHRQHLVNVFIWPDSRSRPTSPAPSSRQGYALVHWSDGAMTYWVASDLNSGELLQFCEQLKAKAAKPS